MSRATNIHCGVLKMGKRFPDMVYNATQEQGAFELVANS